MVSTDENTQLDVSIAIISHRHAHFLAPCLESIFDRPLKARCKITLVDNIGEDCILELVSQRFPQVELVVNDKPMGFAANNNLVFRDSNARYMFLLNPDTVLRDGAIDYLVDYMDAHENVGACGPKLLYPDGKLQLSCREFPTLKTILLRRTPLRLLFGNSATVRRYTMANWNHDLAQPVGWLFGAAILARRETWEAVGPLDEEMFMYCEDIDWCMRCRLGGWDIHYVPQSQMIHHLDDGKYNDYLSRSRRQHYRTMLQFFFKYPRACLSWKEQSWT